MRDKARVTYQIMANVKEESGFYEIPDDLASLLPDSTLEERIWIVKDTIRECFHSGLIDGQLAEWPRKIVQQVTANDSEVLLKAEATWQKLSDKQGTYAFAVLSNAGQQVWINANSS